MCVCVYVERGRPRTTLWPCHRAVNLAHLVVRIMVRARAPSSMCVCCILVLHGARPWLLSRTLHVQRCLVGVLWSGPVAHGGQRVVNSLLALYCGVHGDGFCSVLPCCSDPAQCKDIQRTRTKLDYTYACVQGVIWYCENSFRHSLATCAKRVRACVPGVHRTDLGLGSVSSSTYHGSPCGGGSTVHVFVFS